MKASKTVNTQPELVPLQVETTARLRSALKAGVACSEGKYRSMRDYIEQKIIADFGDYVKEEA